MPDHIDSQLRKGVVESCVLGLIERESMYGWQLSESLIERGLIASIGTLYPMLSRMRSRGLISAFELTSETGPVRKYYRLTPLGTQALDTFREQWQPFSRTVDDIMRKDDRDDK